MGIGRVIILQPGRAGAGNVFCLESMAFPRCAPCNSEHLFRRQQEVILLKCTRLSKRSAKATEVLTQKDLFNAHCFDSKKDSKSPAAKR